MNLLLVDQYLLGSLGDDRVSLVYEHCMRTMHLSLRQR